MKLYHIVAASAGGVIGKENRLPWRAPADLKRFKKLTIGSTVIMGRKTFESLGRKSLPDRKNFVLTRSSPLPHGTTDLNFFSSLEEVLRSVTTEKVFIIGGAEVFKETFDRIEGIYLTKVTGDYEGDTYYPVKSVEELEGLGFAVVSRQRSAEDPRLEFIELKREALLRVPGCER